jgi:hypothetical protein
LQNLASGSLFTPQAAQRGLPHWVQNLAVASLIAPHDVH